MKTYQKEAYHFAVYPKGSNYPVLGLAEETGELVAVFAKALRKGVEPDHDKIVDEASDVLWQLCAILTDHGITLEEIMDHNLSKLSKRLLEGTIKER